MARRMLIDASHPEETRVAVVNGKRLEDFDYETSRKKQLKGNVYLAKIVRVEPSLQAAFVDYGGNRHGFLAFSEIHPDYYQIPVADREQLLAEEAEADDSDESENGGPVETVGGDEVEEVERRRIKHYRHYKIQEVIKRRQIMLVQVVKEERGNKGAALTTYLSLAGRYCVLMPNTGRGGGISRKIGNVKDRRRLKKVLDEFKISPGMAVIVRTAGAERTKAEVKRDYEYLVKLWDDIRARTMESIAPTLVHEEANLIKRSIRDLYSNDIEEVQVDGEAGYRIAKDFMKAMVPSHAKRVQRYEDPAIPLFFRYQVETQIDAIYNPIAQLRSGGYLVINATEALVAIDVNSGRATRERHIEETALKTNMEAAEEVARQLRLRDLAGLIVIDFIDMEENRNNTSVERRLKESLRNERARIQIGHISAFGLLEMSRQRLRPSLIETSSEVCEACGGTGHIRSTESTALHVMRGIEEEGLRRRAAEIKVFVPTSVALYILNHKRDVVVSIEERCELTVVIAADDTLVPPEFRIERVRSRDGREGDTDEDETVETEETSEEGGRRKRRPRRRRKDRQETETVETVEAAEATEATETAEDGEESREAAAAPEAGNGEEETRKRRRRGKRGGRRRNKRSAETAEATETASAPSDTPVPSDQPPAEQPEPDAIAAEAAGDAAPIDAAGDSKPKKKPASRRRKKAEPAADDAAPVEAIADTVSEPAAEPEAGEIATAEEPEEKPAKRARRRSTARKTDENSEPAAKPAPRKRASRKKKDESEPAVPAASEAEPDTQTPVTPEPAEPVLAELVPEPAFADSAPAGEAPANQAAPDSGVDDKPKRSGWWRRSGG